MNANRIRTLPNYLTILRMALVPVFILLYYTAGPLISLIIFAIAAYTDFIDGRIARKNDCVTNFGKFFDPLADKLLVASAFLVLLKSGPGLITTWMFLVIIGREVIVTLLRMYAATKGNVIAATRLGKYKASSQMYTILLSLLLLSMYDVKTKFFSDRWDFLRDINNHNGPIYYLMFIPVLLTIVSGLEFIYNNRKLLKL